MARFYSDKELRGATVYDRLGLAYGILRGTRVEGGTLLLEVMIRASGRVVDVDSLRRKLGIHEASVEELVAEARRRGIGIPYRRLEGEVEMLKGLVPVSEVWVADYSELPWALRVEPRPGKLAIGGCLGRRVGLGWPRWIWLGGSLLSALSGAS